MQRYEVEYRYPHLIPQHIKDLDADIIKSIRNEIAMHPTYGKVIKDNQVPALVETLLDVMQFRDLPIGSWFSFLNKLYWYTRGFRRFMKLDIPTAEEHHANFCRWLSWNIEALKTTPFQSPSTYAVDKIEFNDFVLSDFFVIYRFSAYYDIDYTVMVNRFVKKAVNDFNANSSTPASLAQAKFVFETNLQSLTRLAECYPITGTVYFLMPEDRPHISTVTVKVRE